MLTALFCYGCKKHTKSKLEDKEDENNKHICLCLFKKFIWWKVNKQENRKYILLRLYNLNDFLFLSSPSSIAFIFFVYSLEKYLKWLVLFDTMMQQFFTLLPFCYYDVTFFYNIFYIFVLSSRRKTGYTNFWSLNSFGT